MASAFFRSNLTFSRSFLYALILKLDLKKVKRLANFLVNNLKRRVDEWESVQ
ncbi:hypothetical protein DAD78_04290 [Streptococcus agalactiae]|uniref:Uncharacterized protein n=1 Tax=Streptococcus agalactiae serotype V (strain ATCC BAA-611 / 2603 V/R) TaxID=208435 RepID=Q8DXH0_STRA5|nr:hypothetical protein SAG1881 [Streptococcus agalactiae 2603V/R]KAA9085952.1 hypothetical protein F5L06_01630 [Streptococcus agalactiae]QBB24812.1 hypothetical protein DZL40_08645 [Streptococcus pyogenes]MQP21534.1 hypothetical protein [Streptococcus agalactiae]QET54692.1 hypothetical protein FOB78_11030 [Streptococcus agalactiae]